MSYEPSKMLVTGGAGFIGSNFVHRLQRDGRQRLVVTLDRFSTGGDRRNLDGLARSSDHVLVEGDICDQRLVGELLRAHEIDTIVHFAAESHVDRSIADPATFYEANVAGTLRLLQAATAYWIDDRAGPANRAPTLERSVLFHHVSTDEVYGSLAAGAAPFTEATPYNPRSPYAASKAAADHLVRAWHNTYGLPVTISNCSNNYGPHQHREKLIPTVIRCCLAQSPIPVYGDGSNRRDWLYVDDHCAGVDAVIHSGTRGDTYNIGAGTELANNDIVTRVCAVLDELLPADRPYATLMTHVEDRPGHDWRYAMDAAKAMREVNWTPQRALDDGLRATCSWYLAHPERLG